MSEYVVNYDQTSPSVELDQIYCKTWTELFTKSTKNVYKRGPVHYRGRSYAAKALVIVTDGPSSKPYLTLPAMQAFRAANPTAVVMVVGVNNANDVATNAEQRALASGFGDSNVFSVSGFGGLS